MPRQLTSFAKGLQSKQRKSSPRGGKLNAGIRTFICEPNYYARQWMALLVARDWHTQLVGDTSTLEDLLTAVKKELFEVLLLSTAFCQHAEMTTLAQALHAKRKPPQILWVGKPEPVISGSPLPPDLVAGCLDPDIIQQCLAWAVYFASKGNLIITPSGGNLMSYWDRFPNRPLYELDGRRVLERHRLTKRDIEVVRLAFLFSIERADLDDETNMQQNTPQMQISRVYHKIGLGDIPDEPEKYAEYFEQDEVIIEHYKEIVAKRKGNLKKGNESLAFHLLTRPEIRLLRKGNDPS